MSIIFNNRQVFPKTQLNIAFSDRAGPGSYTPPMVLFDKRSLLDFPRYGIAIPALDSRKTLTLEALESHPVLGGRSSEWLIDSYDDTTALEDILRVNDREYAEGFFDTRAARRLIDGYELKNPDGSYNRWDPESAVETLDRMVPSLLQMVAGTYRASRVALNLGFCHYLGGGAHHGHRGFGHGFCPLNDTAIAIRRLQAEGSVVNVWVIDVDAHKGDGTAAIFKDDDSVFTLSVHMAAGWPLDGSLPPDHPSWTPSDIDIPVHSGEEQDYNTRLATALENMKNRSTADLAIVLAGADPWEGDELPSTRPLNLNLAQLEERDRLVWNFLEDASVPSAWLTAGGYGRGSWQIHTAFLSWVLPRRLAG